MENALFSDISPNIREHLERRGRNLADRSKNANAAEQEVVKAIYIRAVPLLKDFEKNTWGETPTQTEALRNMLMLRGGALGENSTIGPPSLEYDPTKRQGKPTAGLTGLTVEQKGLGEGLISVITLKGLIPSIDDLDFYLPFLFTPGNYWLLEWGFTKTSGTTNLINLQSFFAQREVQKLYDIVDVHRKETGENDAVIGCTKTYEYSVNDAGGFEFTIEMLSNSTLFKKNIQATTSYTIGYYDPPSEEEISGVAPAPNPGVSIEDIATGQAVADATTEVGKQLAAKMRKQVHSNNQTFRTATPRDFFGNLKEYMVRICSWAQKGSLQSHKAFTSAPGSEWGAKLLDGSNQTVNKGARVIDINTGYNSIKKNGFYYRSNLPSTTVTYQVKELGSTLGTINNKKVKHNFDIVEGELGPYCTWGWMEDNILSVAYGMVGSEIGEAFKVESTDNNGIPNILNSHNALYTVDPSKVIIPGKTAEEFERVLQEEKVYSHSEKEVGENQFKRREYIKRGLDVFDTYHPIVKEYTKLSEAALPFDSNSISEAQQFLSSAVRDLMTPAARKAHTAMAKAGGVISESDMYDQREKNVSVNPGIKGSLRRLILHWSVIQEAFKGASTVDIGLKKLYSIIEREYEGFWKFDQMSTDTKLSTIEINSIKEGDPRKAKTDETGKPIYTFPSYSRIKPDGETLAQDPLVISQQLSVTIPDSAGLAMMFANNRGATEALANSNFGDNIDNQLIAELTKETKISAMIQAKPTFQRGEIRIANQIDENGVAHRTQKINPGQIFSKSTLPRNPIHAAYEDIGTFISDGWEFTTGVVTDVVLPKLGGLQFGKTYGAKQANMDPTLLSFSFGRAIDAHGKMYPGYHSRMLFYINNQIFVDKKLVSGKTTRLLNPVKLTFKVLGVSGLNWGNKFNISYMPAKYREQTCFSVASITHNIADNKWTTEITGTLRYLPTEKVLVHKLSLDPKLLGPIEDSLSKADETQFKQLAKAFGDKTPAMLGGAVTRFKISKVE